MRASAYGFGLAWLAVLGAGPASAQPAQGDVTTAITVGSHVVSLPVVPAWRYRRGATAGGKRLQIAGGGAGSPQLTIQTTTRRVVDSLGGPAQAFQLEREAALGPGTKLIASGQRAVAGVACPYFMASDRQGGVLFKLQLATPDLTVDVGFSAATRASFQANEPIVDRFLAGLQVK